MSDSSTYQHCLKNSVAETLKMYFKQLNGDKTNNLYQMVIEQTERSLFQHTLDYTEGNQSRAAECLGITRSTLRKKIKQYGIEISNQQL